MIEFPPWLSLEFNRALEAKDLPEKVAEALKKEFPEAKIKTADELEKKLEPAE